MESCEKHYKLTKKMETDINKKKYIKANCTNKGMSILDIEIAERREKKTVRKKKND